MGHGQNGYMTPTVRGVPNASMMGIESEVVIKWADCLHNHCYLGCSQCFRARDKI